MIFAEDLILEDSYGLDELFHASLRSNNSFAIASCRYRQNGIPLPESSHRFIGGDESTPIMPLAGLMLRRSLNSVRGIDKRFIGVNYDLDLAMRFYERGGFTFFSDVFAPYSLRVQGGIGEARVTFLSKCLRTPLITLNVFSICKRRKSIRV